MLTNDYQDAFYFLSFLPTTLDFLHHLRHHFHYSFGPLTLWSHFQGSRIYLSGPRPSRTPSLLGQVSYFFEDRWLLDRHPGWKRSKLKLAPESQTQCVQQAVHLITTLFLVKILVTQGRLVGSWVRLVPRTCHLRDNPPPQSLLVFDLQESQSIWMV